MRIAIVCVLAATLGCGSPDSVLIETAVTPKGAGALVVEPTQDTYLVGDTVRITATPTEGYTFVRYDGSIVSASAKTSVTLQRDMNITATFIGAEVSLTRLVEPEGSGSIAISPTGAVHMGETVKLTAKPAAGFEFVSWDGVDSEKASASLLLEDDAEVTARFAKIDNSVTLRIVNDLPRDGNWAQMNTLIRLRVGATEGDVQDSDSGELLTAGDSSCSPKSIAPGKSGVFDVAALKPDYFVYVQTGAWEYEPYFGSCWDLYLTSVHDCGGNCCTDKSATTQVTGHKKGVHTLTLSSLLPAKTWSDSPLCDEQ